MIQLWSVVRLVGFWPIIRLRHWRTIIAGRRLEWTICFGLWTVLRLIRLRTILGLIRLWTIARLIQLRTIIRHRRIPRLRSCTRIHSRTLVCCRRISDGRVPECRRSSIWRIARTISSSWQWLRPRRRRGDHTWPRHRRIARTYLLKLWPCKGHAWIPLKFLLSCGERGRCWRGSSPRKHRTVGHGLRRRSHAICRVGVHPHDCLTAGRYLCARTHRTSPHLAFIQYNRAP